jgi:cytochrome c oxidase subunit 4
MPGAPWLNLGSLLLGLVAWILPVVNLLQRHNADRSRNWMVFSIASVSACAIALVLQIFYTNHLVRIEDWSALMDTSSAVAKVATFLLVVTLMLNAGTLAVHYGKRDKADKTQFG